MGRIIDALRWSVERAASEFGVDHRGIKKRLKAFNIKPGPDGLYSTQEIHAGVCGDIGRERLRKVIAEAEGIELRNKQARAEVMPVEEVARAWSAVISVFKERLIQLPAIIESQAAPGIEGPALRKLVELHLDEALKELSTTHEYERRSGKAG